VPDKADGAAARRGRLRRLHGDDDDFLHGEDGRQDADRGHCAGGQYHNLIAGRRRHDIGMMIVMYHGNCWPSTSRGVMPLKWIRIAAALVYALLAWLTLTGRAALGIG